MLYRLQISGTFDLSIRKNKGRESGFIFRLHRLYCHIVFLYPLFFSISITYAILAIRATIILPKDNASLDDNYV